MLRPVGRRLTCWRKQAGNCLELATRLLEVAVKTCRGPVNSRRAARQTLAQRALEGGCIIGRGCGGLLSQGCSGCRSIQRKGSQAVCLMLLARCRIGSNWIHLQPLRVWRRVSEWEQGCEDGMDPPPPNLRRSGSACLARSAAQVASPLFQWILRSPSIRAQQACRAVSRGASKNEIRPRGPSSKHFVRKNPAAYCWPSFFPFPFPPFKPRPSRLFCSFSSFPLPPY